MRDLVISKVNEIQQQLNRPILVLDVGGGYFPFAQATHVIDAISYDKFREIYDKRTYSKAGIWGGNSPKFSRDTWFIHNLSSSEPLPFPDKYFDFCVCCHVLEDLVNPFRAVEEINRVAKAGYIEVPSKEIECTLGVDGILSGSYPGYNHHFWLFTLSNDELLIEPKYSFLGAYKCFHFPKRYKKGWTKQGKDIVMYFWEDKIKLKTPDLSLSDDLRIKQKLYIQSKMGYNFSMFIIDLYKILKTYRNKICDYFKKLKYKD